MTRDERQALGVQKWVDNRCKGTLEYATGRQKINILKIGLLKISIL